MRYLNRFISFSLALCIMAAVAAPISFAAAPKVVTDETAYLMLDYYGSLENYSVVKGCDLNGNTQFADYGDYSSVQNMSTLDEPIVSDSGVSWTVNSLSGNRFYYEVTPKKQSADSLPWTVDVSYKLNGVPAHADKLAGASGLVTVDIKVTPNEKANAYYRDNFMLVCGMMADMADNYSFAAPGGQVQALGSYQAAFNMALPKQEEEFTFEIGSNSFETTGVILLMVPATLSQLDDISDIKEHKGNLEDAGNATDAVMKDILDIIGSMSGGMNTTVAGLGRLEEARDAIDKSRDSISQSVGKLKASIKELEKGLNNYSEFLGDSHLADALGGVGSDMTEIAELMGAMGTQMEGLSTLLTDVKNDVIALNGTAVSSERQALLDDIAVKTGQIEYALSQAQSGDNSFKTYLERMEASVSSINSIASGLDSSESDAVIKAAISSMYQGLTDINSVMYDMSSQSDTLTTVIGSGLPAITASSEEIEDLLEETSYVMDDASDMLKDTRGMIEAVDKMLNNSSDALNDGAKLSIAGVTQMLNDMLAVLDKTNDIQKNRQIISDIVRDEWHRFDDEFGILDIDTSAEKLSFTSAKNPEPRSLQIVLRTHEISLDDVEDEVPAVEDATPDTVWGRIALVFKKMGDAAFVLFN